MNSDASFNSHLKTFYNFNSSIYQKVGKQYIITSKGKIIWFNTHIMYICHLPNNVTAMTNSLLRTFHGSLNRWLSFVWFIVSWDLACRFFLWAKLNLGRESIGLPWKLFDLYVSLNEMTQRCFAQNVLRNNQLKSTSSAGSTLFLDGTIQQNAF